jgi:hypothetical protein
MDRSSHYNSSTVVDQNEDGNLREQTLSMEESHDVATLMAKSA